MEDRTIVNEIISWATEKIKEEEVPDLRLGFNKSVSGTTKLYLSQYLLKIVTDWEKQKRILMFKEELIKSLMADVIGKDEQIKKVNERLERMRKEKRENAEESSNRDEIDEVSINKKTLEEPKALAVVKNINERANDWLSYRNRSLRDLAPLIFGSIFKMLPDREGGEADWEKKYAKMQKEKAELAGKYRAMYNEYRRTLQRYNKDQSKFDERSASFEKYIHEIIRENNALMAKAAESGGKGVEFIGDYGKREHYQVAKEYKEFCLHQGMEFLAEEIVTWEQHRNDEPYDRKKQTEQMIERKVRLSESLLLKPYKLQIKKLRKGDKITGFKEFSNETAPHMLMAMKCPDEKKKEFMIIAEKAFNLIQELVNLTPPCQLLLAERGDVFNAEEHDVDDMYCEPEGIVKATIVPGIYSGHQILMKPVVFTEPIDDQGVVSL